MTVTINNVDFGMVLKAITCGACGIPFGIPSYFEKARLNDGKSFYCPNGHYVGWGNKDEIDRLKEVIERERADRAYWREEYAKETASHRATKGQVTKLKKRVAAGVCPCCTRTFTNLQRHMANQHPEYP